MVFERFFGKPEEWMQDQLRKFVSSKMNELPQEAKAAVERTRVDVVRRPDRIEIAIETDSDSDVEKVRDVFLDNLVKPLSWMIGLFGFKVNEK